MTPQRYARLRLVLDQRQPDLTVVTQDPQKSHNVAAVLRTADAVGIYEAHTVVADGDVMRHHMISGGSRKWVRLRVHRELSEAHRWLRSRGFTVLAAHPSPRAVDYRTLDYTRPTALLLGSELTGVSAEAAELADKHVTIPMHGMVASFNVSVAAAIILAEAQRQREEAGLYRERRLDEDTYQRTLFEWGYPRIAARCRTLRLSYPGLDEQGRMRDNPLSRGQLRRVRDRSSPAADRGEEHADA